MNFSAQLAMIMIHISMICKMNVNKQSNLPGFV